MRVESIGTGKLISCCALVRGSLKWSVCLDVGVASRDRLVLVTS